jgi:hypothetical protein
VASSPPAAPLSALGLVVALLFGAIVRLTYVLGADFPLHDGGLFYAMARDVQQAGYAVPAYSSYNAAQVPFAYPHLASTWPRWRPT